MVLAGAGHVEYGRGIPARVQRRLPVPSATVINGTLRPFDPTLADYILFPRQVELPAAGLLGVMLDTESEGEGIGVQGFSETSGAKTAGVEEGDRIVRVGDTVIEELCRYPHRVDGQRSRPAKLPVDILREPLLGWAGAG